MKLADRVIETHSAGVRSESGFTIAQTSKMFKILSDSLYSDKVMAVIRELSTNAYDSHISAGNKNPFKVVLPNSANPNFIVRDYGTGLSQTDMENLYTTYGASNKNDSNDFVGCLGLGSKSPFAYSKSFTTSSYFDGKKYTYVAAIDDSGVPTLNLFSVSDTSEPNGLEISFAVKQHDFSEFTQKAIRIFHYFKMKPIIEGGVGVYNYNTNMLKDHSYSNKTVVINGDGWRVCRLNPNNNMFPNNYHKVDSGVIAIMGNIAYPVQTNQIVGEQKAEVNENIQRWNRTFAKADIDSWKSFVTEILNQGLYLELDFGIGELEMDVSREGLQYTKNVIKALREKTQDIYLEMKDEFSKKIQEAKTKIEAITSYYTMNDLAGGWGVGASWTDSKGKKHTINSGEDIEYKMSAGKALYVFNYRTSGYRSRRMVYLTDKIHHATLTGKTDYYYYASQRKTGPLTFFVCDVKSEETAKKIVTRYCNEKDCFAYLMIDTKDLSKSNEGFDQLITDVGGHNILKVSDYKDLIKSNTPRKSGNKGSKGSVSDQDVFFVAGESKDSGKLSIEYNDALSLRTLTSDELDEFTDSEDIIYVPILRYASTSGFPAIEHIRSLFQSDILKELFGEVKIYAIKNNFVSKLKDEGYNLIDFNVWFKDILRNEIKTYFNDTNEYNAVVEFYKKEYADRTEKEDNYYYRSGNLIDQFCCHMLSIFGLEYKNYIKNTELVNIIDSYLVMEFFADTMHRGTYDLKRFSQTDYFSHVDSLLDNLGINSLDSKDLRKKNVQYNELLNKIRNGLYTEDDAQEYLDLFKSSVKSSNKKFAKSSELRKMLKAEVDKNPMLKYIMGSNQINGNLRDLDSTKNPIRQFADNYYGYGDRNNLWIEKMDKDSVELFKIQLSSLIK
jgi:hypothetical protein